MVHSNHGYFSHVLLTPKNSRIFGAYTTSEVFASIRARSGHKYTVSECCVTQWRIQGRGGGGSGGSGGPEPLSVLKII